MIKAFRSDSGASLVEFAVLAPVMLLLLIGLIEIGRFAYFSILAANGARAGVAFAAQNLSTAIDTTGIQNAAVQDAQNLSQFTAKPNFYCLSSSGTSVTCPAAGATPAPGEVYWVQVQVTGTFNSLFKYPGIPQSVLVSGTSTMRIIQQ
jgi:Flp pilus assembly protein TadG